MKIAELFYSIQGEGALVGVPSFFIRTSGCNLRCSWCDTPYTSWHPEGTDLTLDQILDEVRAHPARHVVVTGMYVNGRVAGTGIVTKCPSKYAPTKNT